jgi:TolB-like protein
MNMINKRLLGSASVLVTLLILGNLSGCSQTPKKTAQILEKNAAESVTLPNSIAILPFTNSTKQENAPQMLRKTLFGHLATTNYQFAHLQQIDNQLAVINTDKALSSKDAAMLTTMFDVDALIFGEVLSYQTIYAGLVAHINFEVRMSLVSKSGELIWTDEFSQMSTEGSIGSTPWSMLYGLVVTAMHLDDENLFAVADKLGREIAEAIPQPKGFKGPSQSMIESVIHGAHGKFLKYGEKLNVGIKGSPNKNASVSIEGINQIFNLNEVEPGVYLADIDIDNRWNGKDLLLTGYLTDSLGQVSKAISPAGLINIDNITPNPVTLIKLSSNTGTLHLEWQASEPDVRYEISQILNDEKELLAVTKKNQLSFNYNWKPFEMVNIEIIAIDSAKNKSEVKRLSDTIYPFAAISDAVQIKQSRLPAKLAGQVLLKKRYGPYFVDQNVVLAQGSSLYIEPGTIIEYANQGNLQIMGSLYLFGQDPVLFRPISQGLTAQTFLTLNSSEHVQLQGFQIKGAGIAIDVLKGKPLISDCLLENSQYSALVLSNMASVLLDNCHINGSNTSALVVKDQSRIKVTNSKFSNNMPFHIQSSSVFSIEAKSNQWSPEASPMSILGNVRY